MNEKKPRRNVNNRLKLHETLDKKEKELVKLQKEVEELRELVHQADETAITSIVATYGISPEKLDEILFQHYGNKTNLEPALEQAVTGVIDEEETLDEKEDPIDDENT